MKWVDQREAVNRARTRARVKQVQYQGQHRDLEAGQAKSEGTLNGWILGLGFRHDQE